MDRGALGIWMHDRPRALTDNRSDHRSPGTVAFTRRPQGCLLFTSVGTVSKGQISGPNALTTDLVSVGACCGIVRRLTSTISCARSYLGSDEQHG